MENAPCNLIGEVSFGINMTFEEVAKEEQSMKLWLEAALNALGAAYLDFQNTPDSLIFSSFLPETCLPEDVHSLCMTMTNYVHREVIVRIVEVRHNFNNVVVYVLTSDHCTEASVWEP